MKDKKQFGAFIKQKRLDKNYSQKDLAELLFVTESAVSKWERGITYPDITLIKDICRELEITEHELIESSNDYEYRKIKKDATQYNKIKKVLFWILNICYIVAAIVCFIVNISVNHTLSWFFIVLASIICSYSFCPTITWLFTKYKKLVFISSTFISLFLLFLTCSIYTNNYWFMIPTMSVLLAYFIILYPIFFVKQKQYIKFKKSFLLSYSLIILILIYLLLIFIYCYHPYNLGLGLIITGGIFVLPLILGIFNLFNMNLTKPFLILLICIFILFVLFGIGNSIYLKSTTISKTYNIDQSYNNIKINLNDYDINFHISENNEHKLIYKHNKKVYIKTEIVKNSLIINQIDNRKLFSKFNIGNNYIIDIYLPKQVLDSLNIKSSTGDINIFEGYVINNIKINNSTGDVKFEASSIKDLTISTSTGDISIVNSEIEKNLDISISTGDINIKNTNIYKLDIESNTGDTKLKNTIVTTDFTINGKTGDIIFDEFDAANIYITLSTGNVKGTILTDKIFNAQSKTGNVETPRTYTGGICEITVSTGDIIISYK